MTRTFRPVAFFSLALALLAYPTAASAEVAVGDKPTLAFNDAKGGAPVSLEKFKGKIIVVDFWATWCGPCMAEAEHMVQLNNTYAPKGLQMIGVSLDANASQMLKVAAEKGFNWPQYIDGAVWKTKPAQEWGVHGIPSTFIIGPDGTVLWNGHPARIEAPLADAFKNHPPQLVDPKVLAEATRIADQIESQLKESNQASALKLLPTFPAAAKADGAMAQRMAAIEKQFEEYANKSLAEVDPLIQQKQYADAAAKLNELTRSLGSLPAGQAAKKRLYEVLANPEAKAQFEAIQKNKAGEDELAVAKRLQTDGKDEQAFLKYKSIANTYAGTPAGDAARDAIAAYEKNPALVQKANDSVAAAKVKGIMGMAQNYQKAGRTELATKKYQEVITTYPNTSFAKEAQLAIDEIKRNAPK